jgi:hypothetical protein
MTRSCAGSAIVYERDGAWSRALRRFVSPEISVVELPPFQQFGLPPENARAALAVVAGPEDAEPVLAWARRMICEDRRALRMAVVRPSDQELAWCLRETGIGMIWDEFWQVPAMAQMVERFCRRHRRPDLSVEQRIWNNLPWSSNESGLEGGRSNAR